MDLGRAERFSQLVGLFSPTSPSSCARAAMPRWNSGGKLSSESCGRPSALSPWKLNAMLTQTLASGLTGFAAEVITVLTRRSISRPALRSSM